MKKQKNNICLIKIIRWLQKLSKKTMLIILLSYISFLLYGGDISTLEKDVMNYPKEGYRLESFGNEYYISAQGSIKQIDYKYAFCICGRGFFVLQNQKNEILFTRNGFFKLNEEGFLVNQEGHFVLGSNSDIQNKKYEYISSDMILDKKDIKPTGLTRVDSNKRREIDYFLIMEPIDITSFHNDCVTSKEAIRIKTNIQQYAREAFPVSFEQLLDLALEIFENTKDEENIEQKKNIYCLLEYQKAIIFNQFVFEVEDKQRLEMKLQQIKNKI
jgi:flagellar hook protein FlgE